MPRKTERRALRDGLLAVTTFAATLPLTRLALEGFTPLPLTFARLLGAAVPALLLLALVRAPWPRRHQWGSLALVTLCGVVAFPLLTALAMERHAAAPAAIPLALIPLATVIWTRWRGDERPATAFWLWAGAGTALVLHFVWQGAPVPPELFAAAGAAAIAYGEGARLAREMPGWQVMGWALVLFAPAAAVGVGQTWGQAPLPESPAPWAALAFLAVVTQFGAFWFWYRALATGVARTSQLQLLQPFLTLLLAALLLGESIAPQLWFYAGAVVASVHLARAAGRRATLQG